MQVTQPEARVVAVTRDAASRQLSLDDHDTFDASSPQFDRRREARRTRSHDEDVDAVTVRRRHGAMPVAGGVGFAVSFSKRATTSAAQ
jgi:hypothetical protein